MTPRSDPGLDAGGDEVAEFFALQVESENYRDLKSQTEAFDRAAAAILNREARGRILGIGGLWDHFQRTPEMGDISVIDLSTEMLISYASDDATVIRGDIFDIDLGPATYDTIVFPLMLHHVARGGWSECERRVRDALTRAADALAPGGRILIYEYCPAPWLRLAQRLALPITRRLLARNRQPLVVMHSLRFYQECLEAATGRATVIPIVARPPKPWSWYPVFMSSRWLRIPIGLYPKPAVIAS